MADQHDMGEAEGTYAGFLSLLKWGTIISVAVTVLVVLIIAS